MAYMTDDAAAELRAFEAQLADVEQQLTADPNNAELREMRQELRDIIALQSDVLASEPTPQPQPQPQPQSTTTQPTPPPPPPSSSQRAAGIAQVASAKRAQEVSELAGWRIGDSCRAPFMEDMEKYSLCLFVVWR